MDQVAIVFPQFCNQFRQLSRQLALVVESKATTIPALEPLSQVPSKDPADSQLAWSRERVFRVQPHELV